MSGTENDTNKKMEDSTTKGAVITLDLETSRDYIKSNLEEIEEVAEAIMEKEGFNYEATAVLEPRWVPEKTYGNVTFPAGNYEALNITLGEGEGENWWCVLFPPLCLIGVEEPESMQGDVVSSNPIPRSELNLNPNQTAIYEAALADVKYNQVIEATKKPTKLKLKFKTLEFLDERKQK